MTKLLAIGLGAAILTGCTTTPPQTQNTWTGEWEPAPVATPTQLPCYDGQGLGEPMGPACPEQWPLEDLFPAE